MIAELNTATELDSASSRQAIGKEEKEMIATLFELAWRTLYSERGVRTRVRHPSEAGATDAVGNLPPVEICTHWAYTAPIE